MRNHISYRSGNPALQSSTFKNNAAIGSGHMTLEGTINKVSLSLLVLMCTAMYTWNNPSYPIMIFGAIGGFIIGKVSVILFPNLNLFPFSGILLIWVFVYVNNRNKQTKNQDEDDSTS